MPSLTVRLDQLYEHREDIPADREDCYLTAIWTDCMTAEETQQDDEEDGNLSGGFYKVPWRASQVDALTSTRNGEKKEWKERWGGTTGGIRLGCNTPGVPLPLYMTFTWGEGDPVVDGITMLPHQATMSRYELPDGTAKYYPINYCRWCSVQMPYRPHDCVGRRLDALKNAVTNNDDIEGHFKAIEKWHGVSKYHQEPE